MLMHVLPNGEEANLECRLAGVIFSDWGVRVCKRVCVYVGLVLIFLFTPL